MLAAGEGEMLKTNYGKCICDHFSCFSRTYGWCIGFPRALFIAVICRLKLRTLAPLKHDTKSIWVEEALEWAQRWSNNESLNCHSKRVAFHPSPGVLHFWFPLRKLLGMNSPSTMMNSRKFFIPFIPLSARWLVYTIKVPFGIIVHFSFVKYLSFAARLLGEGKFLPSIESLCWARTEKSLELLYQIGESLLKREEGERNVFLGWGSFSWAQKIRKVY